MSWSGAGSRGFRCLAVASRVPPAVVVNKFHKVIGPVFLVRGGSSLLKHLLAIDHTISGLSKIFRKPDAAVNHHTKKTNKIRTIHYLITIAKML